MRYLKPYVDPSAVGILNSRGVTPHSKNTISRYMSPLGKHLYCHLVY